MKVLVTGSAGFIGSRVSARLGDMAVPFDLPGDVTVPASLASVSADAVIHLAADKYAPQGEESPERVAHLNVVGTANVCRRFPKVILASTCKAANPITAYGASKLIAERVVLNAGGTVVRLVNVLGSTGSVTDIWDQVPPHLPLPVVSARRMFITPDQAVDLLIRALELPPGRYGPLCAEPESMSSVVERLHPGRPWRYVPLRNGDRPVERLTNDFEHAVRLDSQTVRIVDCWEESPKKALEVAA